MRPSLAAPASLPAPWPAYHNELGYNDVRVITKGGKLRVEFDRVGENSFENIWLCGPAIKVFEGDIED